MKKEIPPISKSLLRLALKSAGAFVLFLGVAYFLLIVQNNISLDKDLPRHPLLNQWRQIDRISDFRGKVVLVDFWFQSCAPCLAEMQQFPYLLEKYGDQLQIMSISIDPPAQTKRLLEEKPTPWSFVQKDNPNWTFYSDNRRVKSYVRDLDISTFPSYLLISPEGELLSSPRSGALAIDIHFQGYPSLKLAGSYLLAKFWTMKNLWIPLLVFLGLWEVAKHRKRLSSVLKK
jgi:thiol-disulfide isomerase/thioredoxin